MNFFDRLPRPPAPEPEPPRPRPVWEKPDAVVGAAVPGEVVLARTEDAAVVVTGLLAYPSGFEFVCSTVLRREDRLGRMIDPGFMHGPGRYDDEPLPPEFVRLGVQFADDSVVTNLDWRSFPEPDSTPQTPLLLPGGGGGGGRRYDMLYWIWPLPPLGPVTFVCEWPVHQIPESRGTIEAKLIVDAAARAIRLWPDDGDSIE